MTTKNNLNKKVKEIDREYSWSGFLYLEAKMFSLLLRRQGACRVQLGLRGLATQPTADLEVEHDKTARVFFIDMEDHGLAYLKYKKISTDTLDMYSTVVPKSAEGQGIGKVLADEALQFARENNFGVKLTCWYLAGYLQRHPQPDIKVVE